MDEKLELRISAGELDMFRRAAETADVTLSAFVRDTVRSEALAVLAVADVAEGGGKVDE